MKRPQKTFKHTAWPLVAFVMILSFLGSFDGASSPYRAAFGASWDESAASVDQIIQNGGPAVLSTLQSFMQTGRKMARVELSGFAISPLCAEFGSFQDTRRLPQLTAANFPLEERHINTVKKLE